jgi:hypothetical protein
MIVQIDSDTTLRLRNLKGAKLLSVVGHRYPNPPSYDEVQLHTDRGVAGVSLRMEDVSEKLEVCCISVSPGAATANREECDELRFADFRIDDILVLRRAEWLEPAEPSVIGIGSNAEQQCIGAPSDARPWLTHALVDAGIVLEDGRGSRLLLQADTFPMVLQCHYSISSSTIPHGEARSIDE